VVRPRDEPPDERTTSFVTLLLSALAVFGFYTAIKAAYLSKTFAIVVAERNVIYLTPLLFIGLALALERRRLSLLATLAATAFAAYIVSATPYRLDLYPYYEAHGLSIAALAKSSPSLAGGHDRDRARPRRARLRARSRCARTRARAASCDRRSGLDRRLRARLELTTEIYAANGEKRASDRALRRPPEAPDWVDQSIRRKPTMFIGQGVSDPNGFWQLEFWNPSIKWFWGMDGSTPGGVTPNLLRPDGTQYPDDLGAEFAVVSKACRSRLRK
jgi:hypothetical protein